MPTRTAATPGRLPRCVLARLVRLPEREVARILLERVRLLLLDLVGPLAGKPPVPGIARDAEVHVAFDRVRVLALDELLDEADDLGNHLARLGLVVGHPQAEAAGVLEVPRRHLLGELGARARRRFVDLVVDVRDVVDERRLVPALSEPVSEPHPDHERAGVSDVCPSVDGRPAEVHAHRPWRLGQRVEPTSECVVEPDRHGAALPPWAGRPVLPLAPALCRGRSGRGAARGGCRRRPSAHGRRPGVGVRQLPKALERFRSVGRARLGLSSTWSA